MAMAYVHDYTHRDVRNDANNRTKDTVAASCPLFPSAETYNNNDMLYITLSVNFPEKGTQQLQNQQ